MTIARFDLSIQEFDTLFDWLEGEDVQTVPETVQVRASKLNSFFGFYILNYMKFFDVNREDDDIDNFYMEREWRVTGAVEFELKDVHRLIVPQSFSSRLRIDLPEYLGQVSFAD